MSSVILVSSFLTVISCFCPRCLILTQVEVVGVEQELGQIEKLRNELLDVGHVVFGGREPGFTHTVEHSVSQVKMTSLVITQTDRQTVRHQIQTLRSISKVIAVLANNNNYGCIKDDNIFCKTLKPVKKLKYRIIHLTLHLKLVCEHSGT